MFEQFRAAMITKNDPVHSVRFALGSLHSECQRLAAGRPNLDPYMTYLFKSLSFADLPPHLKGVKIR